MAIKAAAKKSTAKSSKVRVKLATIWPTSKDGFMTGTPQPAEGEYRNNQGFLDMIANGDPLPALPEGYHWQVLGNIRELSNGQTVVDISLEQSDYVREDK